MPFRPKASRFWHYDFQIKGRRFHGSCGTEDFEEAKALEAEARVRAKADPQARGIFTLSEAVGTYWADICQHQPSAQTSLSQAKALIAVIGAQTRLTDITPATLLHFVARRRAEVSNGTVNRQLQFLGRAIRHMASYHAAAVPTLDLPAAEVAEPRERVRELSIDEQAALFKHLRADLHPFVKFALMTGARRATICGLRWPAVDLAAGRMRFELKGGTQMLFPINAELRALLSALPRAPGLPFVFTYLDHRRRDPIRRAISPDGGGIHADFHQAVIDAGIEDFRFHDLRHTFASRMLRRTGNLKLVSRLLGHTQLETTARYAHVLDADLADALADWTALSHPESREKSRSTKSTG